VTVPTIVVESYLVSTKRFPENASTYSLLTTFFNLIVYVKESSQAEVQKLSILIVLTTLEVAVTVHVLDDSVPL